MGKVKVLTYRDPDSLEYRVNEFIAKYRIIDIQFRAFAVGNMERYAAMIMYEEV